VLCSIHLDKPASCEALLQPISIFCRACCLTMSQANPALLKRTTVAFAALLQACAVSAQAAGIL
jgi:hypothetical protein